VKQILVLATTNPGKTREFRDLLKDFPVDIRDLSDFGPIPPVMEDGSTFEENAYKKASFTARILGFPALADDSGLCVDALGGAPGIHSARFAGDSATDADNVARLLSCLENQENRKASFQCVISIAVPEGQALTYEGSCDGILLTEPAGENGFGYDPIFFYPDLNRTFAQMTLAEKARVSHRGKALAEMVQEMDKILQWLDIHEIRTVPSGCGGQH
jgi:XTP/dITP diphosphohydrolase